MRLYKPLLDRLDAEAARNGRTRTEMIHRAIEHYLDTVAADAPDAKPRPSKKTS